MGHPVTVAAHSFHDEAVEGRGTPAVVQFLRVLEKVARQTIDGQGEDCPVNCLNGDRGPCVHNSVFATITEDRSPRIIRWNAKAEPTPKHGDGACENRSDRNCNDENKRSLTVTV